MNGHDFDIGGDLKITKVEPRRTGAPGAWVTGRLNGYDFQALVFAERGDGDPDWELAGSRIAKLWVRRATDQRTVFHWDRGEDLPAADATVERVVDFLCDGLADLVYAG